MNRDFFMSWLRNSILGGRKTIRGRKRLTIVSTNDLDADRNLKPGLDIRNRKQGKKNRGESDEEGAPEAFWSDENWRD